MPNLQRKPAMAWSSRRLRAFGNSMKCSGLDSTVALFWGTTHTVYGSDFFILFAGAVTNWLTCLGGSWMKLCTVSHKFKFTSWGILVKWTTLVQNRVTNVWWIDYTMKSHKGYKCTKDRVHGSLKSQTIWRGVTVESSQEVQLSTNGLISQIDSSFISLSH